MNYAGNTLAFKSAQILCVPQISLKEQEHLAGFTQEALKEDVGHRLRLAQFFAAVTQSKKLHEGWNRYFQIVESEFKITQAKANEVAERVRSLESERKSALKAGKGEQYEIRDLEQKLTQARTELNALRSQLEVSKHSRSELAPYSDLSGIDLSEAELIGINLTGAIITNANLSRINLSRAQLPRANLSYSRINEANLTSTDLNDAKLVRADLSYARINNANLIDADLWEANLNGADLRGALLEGASLIKARLEKSDLRGVVGLRGDQMIEANDWNTAYRDEELACGSNIPKFIINQR